MPPKPQTKPSTRKLSDLARYVVIPEGIVTTGWPRVEQQLGDMGIKFALWQEGITRIALGKRADGLYAATIGGITLSIPRQVGKTFLVGALMMALCVIFPGYTVLWTAHRTRTTTRTFQSMQRMAKRKKIAPHIESVRMANGEQEIRFRNGSVILFGAREQGFGRGFDEVDAEVFDEAQILTEKALEDMIAATNQSRHPHGALLFFMGTPPRPTDPGEAFAQRRKKATEGRTKDAAYVEFSADDDADPDDQKQWAKANPSFPEMTPLESMLRLRENLSSEDGWTREGLGIWDAETSADGIDARAWTACLDAESKRSGQVVFAVEMTPDRAFSTVAVAGLRADGLPHIEVVRRDRGSAWVVAELKRLVEAHGTSVFLDANGPAGSLLADLEREIGSRVVPMTGPEVRAACGAMYDAIHAGLLRHIGQQPLDDAVAAAVKREMGDGGFTWSRRKSGADISSLYAGSLAFGALRSAGPSVYESRGALVF